MTRADLITVASVPSRSAPGTTYTVKQNPETGELSCDCKGWIFSKRDPRSCRHTIVFASIAKALVDKNEVVNPTTPFRKLTREDVDARLKEEEAMLNRVAALPKIQTPRKKAKSSPPQGGVEIRTTIRTITFEDDDE